MVVFILRLNGEHFMSSSATHYNVVQEKQMSVLHNPFSVQINQKEISSLSAGLHIAVSVSTETKVAVFWGVNIQAFQLELNRPAGKIASRLQSGETFEGHFVHKEGAEILAPADDVVQWHLICPSELVEDRLGESPRSMYPAVIVMLREDTDIPQNTTAIMLQLTVIHLKDSLCSLDSHIVYQFVKTNQNGIISLQPIFVSHDEETNIPADNQTLSSEISPKDGNETDLQENLNIHSEDCKGHQQNNDDYQQSDESCDIRGCCCVCQTLPVFYTLLPCRHACVCRSCVKLLDRCPICRGYIDSYFRVAGRNSASETELQSNQEENNMTRWQAFNNWFNDMFGFA
ncbi:hypothetical protein DPMN_090339 [Dreissena polymorpha]|uniref:RING-type domain-containing protein n=3 Tax=Dreissena polymorpha TaxID=45954 RepID=A0A9D4KXJ0_DREPO|nr:hypothetical protein DPMN_090339 [Dreissena polymorpha]